MAIIGFAGKRVKHLMLTPVMTVLLGVMDSPEASLLCLEGQIPSSERAPSQLSAAPLQRPTQGKYKPDLKINSTLHTHMVNRVWSLPPCPHTNTSRVKQSKEINPIWNLRMKQVHFGHHFCVRHYSHK